MVLPVGSSPRVRGKLGDLLPEHDAVRIIPARAGQTRQRHKPTFLDPDHPRACGANATARSGGGQTITGSSPRVRGKLRRFPCRRTACRIIPARAGQTTMRRAGLPANPDHPRACGANRRCRHRARCRYGSSPRVRGKLTGIMGVLTTVRIIPARAGQTCPANRPPPR